MPLSKAARETGIAEDELMRLCEGANLDWHGWGHASGTPFYVKSSDVARYIAGRPHSTVELAHK